jgi:hypothetical protein
MRIKIRILQFLKKKDSIGLRGKTEGEMRSFEKNGSHFISDKKLKNSAEAVRPN